MELFIYDLLRASAGIARPSVMMAGQLASLSNSDKARYRVQNVKRAYEGPL